ncbi:MAG TPA: DMT family transporter [Firmicutes bacterium]|nr:DMT family transporter [Bacillota bacterium]
MADRRSPATGPGAGLDGRSAGLLLALSLIWAVYYLFSQRLVAALTCFPAGLAIRVLTFFLLPLLAAAGRRIRELKPPPLRMMPVMMLIGLLGFLLDFTAFLGLRHESAGGGTVLLKTDVLMAAVIGAVVCKEKFRLRDVGAILLMFSGVLLTMDVFHLRLSGLNDLFFVLSAFFVTLNAFVIQWALHHPRTPVKGMTIGFYNNFYAMLLFGAAVLISGTGEELAQGISRPDVWGVALAAGLGQSFVYVFYYAALGRQPVWIVKVFLLLMPVFTTAIEAAASWLLTGESGLSWSRLAGMALVLAGAAVLLLKKRPAASASPPPQKGE